jgi:hypothetical protein
MLPTTCPPPLFFLYFGSTWKESACLLTLHCRTNYRRFHHALCMSQDATRANSSYVMNGLANATKLHTAVGALVTRLPPSRQQFLRSHLLVQSAIQRFSVEIMSSLSAAAEVLSRSRTPSSSDVAAADALVAQALDGFESLFQAQRDAEVRFFVAFLTSFSCTSLALGGHVACQACINSTPPLSWDLARSHHLFSSTCDIHCVLMLLAAKTHATPRCSITRRVTPSGGGCTGQTGTASPTTRRDVERC